MRNNMTKEEALNWIGISLFIDYDKKDSKKIEEAYKIICKEFEMLDIFYNILSLSLDHTKVGIKFDKNGTIIKSKENSDIFLPLFIKNKHTEKKLIKWLEKMENNYENKQYINRKTSRKRLHNL